MVTTIETPKEDRVCECTHLQSNHVKDVGRCTTKISTSSISTFVCGCRKFMEKK